MIKLPRRRVAGTARGSTASWRSLQPNRRFASNPGRTRLHGIGTLNASGSHWPDPGRARDSYDNWISGNRGTTLGAAESCRRATMSLPRSTLFIITLTLPPAGMENGYLTEPPRFTDLILYGSQRRCLFPCTTSRLAAGFFQTVICMPFYRRPRDFRLGTGLPGLFGSACKSSLSCPGL